MRIIGFLLRKEFSQIFRNKTILAMIIVMPLVQLIVLPLAADYEVKNINLAVVDHDHSTYSARMIASLKASGYFKLVAYGNSYKEALQLIERDNVDVILEVPAKFERGLIRENRQSVFIVVNAINGTKANLGGVYLQSILKDVNAQIRAELIHSPRFNNIPQVELKPTNWYNTYMNYKVFMVPGILAILVTMIAGFLTSLNIVKEKEVGTIEQINVTPIKKHHFILGKLIPFWVLGNVVFTIGLLVEWIFYGIVPLGSLAVLYSFLAVFLFAVLGFGLLISTYCETQQQAMFIAFFFMMIFILMGGLFTSINSMPVWAQVVARLTPISYLIDVMRMVVLKGSGFGDVLPYLGIVFMFAVVLNTWAIINYKKTS